MKAFPKRSHLNNITLKRFLLLYLAFAMLLLCLCIPIYMYIHNVIYDNVRTKSQRMLANGISAMEASTATVYNTYVSTTVDARFRPLRYMTSQFTGSPSDLNALVSTLRYALIPANLVADAGFAFNKVFLITRTRSFYSDTYYSFYPGFLQCDTLSFEEWMEFLRQGGQLGSWLPERTYTSADYVAPYTAITYARTWHNVSGRSAGIYYAALDTDKLTPLLAEAEVLQNGYLQILGSNEQVLLTRGAASPDSADIEVMRAVSSQTSLTVEIGLPKSYLRAQLVPLERMLLLYIASLITIAIVMSILFSQRSAAPMRDLILSMDQAKLLPAEETPEQDKKGFLKRLERDYDAVASGITLLSSQLKSNEEIIAEQKARLSDQLFDRALQHALFSPQDKQDFAHLFPDFPSQYHVVLLKCDLIEESVDEAAHSRSAMLRAAHESLESLYYVHTLASDALLLVLSDGRCEAIEALCQRLQAESIAAHAILSQAFAHESDLPAAFQQVQYMELSPASSGAVTVADPSSQNSDHASLPLNLPSLLEIYGALSAGDDALARIILNDCSEQLATHPDRILLTRHTHSLIGHMLVQMKLEHPTALFTVVIPSFDAKNLDRLMKTELPDCFRSISRCLLDSRTGESDVSAKVLRFIHDNLFSPDMCVTFVTENLGIAKVTLQKVIKNAAGCTFSVYIGNQRMERAYQLLREAGMSVQKVAELCGFSSPNSFYKAFKRKYGVAPSSASGGLEEETGSPHAG